MSSVPPRSAIDDIRSTLEKMGGQFQAVLPTKAHVDRFIRVVMTAVQQTPDAHRSHEFTVPAMVGRMMPDGNRPCSKSNTNIGTRDKPEWRKIVRSSRWRGPMMKLRPSGEVIGAPKVPMPPTSSPTSLATTAHHPQAASRTVARSCHFKRATRAARSWGSRDREHPQRSKQADSGP